MHSKILGLGLISGLMSAAAFAEPPIQPGDTLESLSKVKVVTTVNGQPGSIEELVASGQIKLAEAADVTASSADQTLNPDQAQASQIDPNATAVEPAQAEPTTADAQNSLPIEDQNLTAVPQTDVAHQEATITASQQAEAVVNEAAPELAQQPAPAATEANAAPIIASSANTPVNADVESAALPEAPQAQQDAFMAAPEAPNAATTESAIQAQPQTDVSDDAIQASPEAPQADESIQAAPESADIDSTVN